MTSIVTGLRPKIQPARIFSPAFSRSLVLRAVKSEYSLKGWDERRDPPAETRASVDHRLTLLAAVALLDLRAKLLRFAQGLDRTDIDAVDRIPDHEAAHFQGVAVQQRRELPLDPVIAVEGATRRIVGPGVAKPEMD